MPLITVFNSTEKQLFDKPPQFSAEERQYFFTLPSWTEDELIKIKTPMNKVGFILQLGYFRATKKFYEKSQSHTSDIFFVSKRTGMTEQVEINAYAQTTLLRHRKLILEKLGYQAFSEDYYQQLATEANFLLSKQVKLKEVFESLLLILEQKRVEVPTYNILAHIITDAFRKYQKEIIARIEQSLTKENMALLDTLLTVNEAYETTEKQQLKIKRYKITLLKETDQAVRPSRIQENLSHLCELKEYFQQLQPAIEALQISDETIRYYATIATKAQIPQIARRGNEKYIYLLAFIVHHYYCLQDALVDMLLRAVQTAINKAEDAQKVVLREQHMSRSIAVEKLLTNYLSKGELLAKIELILTGSTLTDSEKVVCALKLVQANAQSKQQQTQDEEVVKLLKHAYGKKHRNETYYTSLQAQSLKLQKRATEIIKQLDFDEASSRESTLTAINYFRQKDKAIGKDAPLDFLHDDELQVIADEHGDIRKSLYKVLLFIHIALCIKSGGLNLKYSYRYRSLDDYLIPKERWEKEKDNLLHQLGLTEFADFATVMHKLELELDTCYRKTNEHILDKTNPYISLHKDGGFSLATPKKEDEELGATIDLFPKANYIPLYEVLTTIQNTTHFLDPLTHIQRTHTSTKPDDKTFYAALIGLGCNIGIKKIGKISRNINQSSLERAVNWYLSEQTLMEANDAILTFTKSLYLPTLFQRDPAIIHTTSDGQQLPVAVESLTANYSYKFKRPGKKAINIYIFKDSRNLLYYSTVFSPTDREAIYVIDGQMHNNVVDPDMHSTDTGGVTEPVFAGMHFLNIFFAPRIKAIDTKQRYAFVKPKEYAAKGYQLLPHATIDQKCIEPQWDEMLCFMATIKLKQTTASQLFHRLNSYSHQHPLYKALKEFGQIIQTIFILRYIDEVDIRQAIEDELNEHEHSNKFGKAVFYDHSHEFQQETKEEQLIAEGCKRLIENAIILWNYLYLSEKVYNTPEGTERDELIVQIKRSSVLTWHHIIMQGEYDFSDEKLKDMHQFNISRILSLSALFQTGVSFLTKIFSRQAEADIPVVV